MLPKVHTEKVNDSVQLETLLSKPQA